MLKVRFSTGLYSDKHFALTASFQMLNNMAISVVHFTCLKTVKSCSLCISFKVLRLLTFLKSDFEVVVIFFLLVLLLKYFHLLFFFLKTFTYWYYYLDLIYLT